jgi:hypothetical protein
MRIAMTMLDSAASAQASIEMSNQFTDFVLATMRCS